MMKNVDDILKHIDSELENQAEEGLSNDDMYWAYDEETYILADEVRRLRSQLEEMDL